MLSGLRPAHAGVVLLAHGIWIGCRINHLREVPLSSDFLRGSALLRCLRVELLLLHRVILRTVVDGQFVEASSGLMTVLSRADGLRLPETVICLVVIIHDSLYLALVVETRDLRRCLAILVPKSIN